MSSTEKPASMRGGWILDRSDANEDTPPAYGYNHTMESPRGHMIEMDDTPDRERVRITHQNGTYIEMRANGNGEWKIQKDGYLVTLGDYNVSIGTDDGNNAQNLNLTVYGDVNMRVTGDKIETIEGNYEQHIKGNYTQVVEKTSRMTVIGDLDIAAGHDQLGSISMTAGDVVMVNSSLSVKNDVTAQLITSKTRVDAIMGMSAGAYGFVTLEGGVAVGVPAASPGKVITLSDVLCGGQVVAATQVLAPMGNFQTMKAVLMTDVVNKGIFAAHIHPTPKGPSGSPMVQFT
jgi:hypothetical protein